MFGRQAWVKPTWVRIPLTPPMNERIEASVFPDHEMVIIKLDDFMRRKFDLINISELIKRVSNPDFDLDKLSQAEMKKIEEMLNQDKI